MRDDAEWVSASEIGDYLYCSHKYWLVSVQGVRPGNGTGGRLQRGVKEHHWHGVKYDLQRKIRSVAIVLAAAVVVALAVVLLFNGDPVGILRQGGLP